MEREEVLRRIGNEEFLDQIYHFSYHRCDTSFEAEELCVPMLYIEDELRIQCGEEGSCGFLRRLEDGRYVNNILVEILCPGSFHQRR